MEAAQRNPPGKGNEARIILGIKASFPAGKGGIVLRHGKFLQAVAGVEGRALNCGETRRNVDSVDGLASGKGSTLQHPQGLRQAHVPKTWTPGEGIMED